MGFCLPIDARIVKLVDKFPSQVLVASNRVLGEALETYFSRFDKEYKEASALLDIAVPRLAHGVVV